jgi:hypothetical protein
MRFPLLFAVPTDDSRDRVSVFSTALLREGPDRWGDTPSVFLVAPYRIYHGHDDSQWPDTAFVRDRTAAAATDEVFLPNHDVMLVADYSTDNYEGPSVQRRVVYRGPWRHVDATVFSMYCATAIPVLRFNGHGYLNPWPTARFNRLPLEPASLDLIRTWVRRWNPEVWQSEIENTDDGEIVHLPRLIPSPLPPPPAVAPSSVASPAPFPAFVSAALVADAVRRNLSCPITLEPINPETATVTSCYHVFDADALSRWVAQQPEDTPPTCPTCKTPL